MESLPRGEHRTHTERSGSSKNGGTGPSSFCQPAVASKLYTKLPVNPGLRWFFSGVFGDQTQPSFIVTEGFMFLKYPCKCALVSANSRKLVIFI
nr:hypothetical protein CFP56_67670 [Quercus suber]